MNKLLIQFLGVPGSGKNTFSRQLAKELGAVVFNSDATRIAIWGSLDGVHADRTSDADRVRNNRMTFGAMDYMAKQVLASGYSVIYDCNANKVADRKDNIAKQYGAKLVIVYIKTPKEVAIARLQSRDSADDSVVMSIDKATATYERFSSAIEPPTKDETVIEINGEDAFTKQYADFVQQLNK